MIEQYIYNRIVADSTLQTLLGKSGGGVHLYPLAVPKGINLDLVFENNDKGVVSFSLITTGDGYPDIKSRNVQFNVFSSKHSLTVEICDALSNIFNEDNNQKSGGVGVVYSQRISEGDIGFEFDENDDNGVYQRETSFYFKVR